MLKKDILRKKEDFDAIYRAGRSVPDRYIVLFYRENDLPYNRTAFLASKKVGNSVQRNRAKRLMKESYRLHREEFRAGRHHDSRGKAEDGEHVFYLDGWGHIPLGCYWNEELIEVITQIINGNQE